MISSPAFTRQLFAALYNHSVRNDVQPSPFRHSRKTLRSKCALISIYPETVRRHGDAASRGWRIPTPPPSTSLRTVEKDGRYSEFDELGRIIARFFLEWTQPPSTEPKCFHVWSRREDWQLSEAASTCFATQNK